MRIYIVTTAHRAIYSNDYSSYGVLLQAVGHLDRVSGGGDAASVGRVTKAVDESRRIH